MCVDLSLKSAKREKYIYNNKYTLLLLIRCNNLCVSFTAYNLSVMKLPYVPHTFTVRAFLGFGTIKEFKLFNKQHSLTLICSSSNPDGCFTYWFLKGLCIVFSFLLFSDSLFSSGVRCNQIIITPFTCYSPLIFFFWTLHLLTQVL